MAGRNVPQLYVGLISGTSMDGIDAVLVTLGDKHSCVVEAVLNSAYDPDLRRDLVRASRNPALCTIDDVGKLDRRVGEAFRDATIRLLHESGTQPASVAAIGSHGQTLRHLPRDPHRFTLQVGDPNIIASGTGITTVADFRRRDVALGGEGAPLAPAFHRWMWSDALENRTVLNIGGFANLTVLPAGRENVLGFDTGPGNTLMDAWSERHLGQPFDNDGGWARSGTVNSALLEAMLTDRYFQDAPPKSTGFEYFNLEWLEGWAVSAASVTPAAMQATLCELTARSIADAVKSYAPATARIMVCGGGAHNTYLLERLAAALPGLPLQTTESSGVGPDWVEAATFAWLAARCLRRQPGNLPAVTGAREATVLGSIFPGRS